MNLKSDKSNTSVDGSYYEFPYDRCDHLFPTSLRDLKESYQDLSREQLDPIGLNKKDLSKVVPGTKSDLK